MALHNTAQRSKSSMPQQAQRVCSWRSSSRSGQPHSTVLHAQHGAAQHGAAERDGHNDRRHSAVQHSTAKRSRLTERSAVASCRSTSSSRRMARTREPWRSRV